MYCSFRLQLTKGLNKLTSNWLVMRNVYRGLFGQAFLAFITFVSRPQAVSLVNVYLMR